MERLQQISNHLKVNNNGITSKNDDDVVIVAAYRTAVTKGMKGEFKNMETDELLYKFLKEMISKVDIDTSLIEDVAVGNVLNKGAGAMEHRAATLAAGVPFTSSFLAVNRQCSSSLTALNIIANQIKVGQIKLGLAMGVESMSKNYGLKSMAALSDVVEENPEGVKCSIPMGITNENVAKKFNISREEQDSFAAKSYNKAEAAIKSGGFKDEILVIENDENSKVVHDSGPRFGVTAESLSKIKPAFTKTGTTHAGNSSQISDGASGVILTTRKYAKEHNLPIVGKYVDFKCVGVPPEIMGVGPAYAIPKVLQDNGIKVDDVAVFEINEAFAAQCLYSINKVGIPMEKVNPKGGAIALGHPLAATGCRQVATLLNELKPGELGVSSMCLGTGMGAAALFVRE